MLHTAIISWQPVYTKPTAAGARETVGGYFVASMPELNLSATGGSHSTALTNLITLASSVNDQNKPYGGIRHY